MPTVISLTMSMSTYQQSTCMCKSGSVGSGVELILTSDAGFTYTVETDSSGNYSFNDLLEGEYSLSANLTDSMLFGFEFSLSGGAQMIKNGILYSKSTVQGQAL